MFQVHTVCFISTICHYTTPPMAFRTSYNNTEAPFNDEVQGQHGFRSYITCHVYHTSTVLLQNVNAVFLNLTREALYLRFHT